MVTDNLLSRLSYEIENLDPKEWAVVKYDDFNFTIEICQRGKVVNIQSIRGLVKMTHKKALLAPEDLQNLKRDLDYCISYPDAMLLAPVEMGFKVYVRDLTVYGRPKMITEISFYSIYNRFFLFLLKIFNKRIRRLMKL